MGADSEKAARLSLDALDFAPDLLAIQERPPSRLPRTLLVTVSALVGLLILWASLAKLDVIASAEGRLVPLSYTKVVQPADAGIVEDILVREGAAVKAGQVLLRMDSRMSQSDVGALQKDLKLKQLTLRRIEAELAERPFPMHPADPADLHAQVHAQFLAHRQAYQDAIAQEAETLNKANADRLAAQQLLHKLTTSLPSYQRAARAYEDLVNEGFVGEIAAAEKRREAIEKEQDLKIQIANTTSLDALIAQSHRKLAGIRSGYRSQLEGERVDTLAQLNHTGNELGKSQIKAGMLEIRAPYDGIVKDLTITTQGSVIAAGMLLMNIVPQNEPLQAEVLLRNEDVGFVAKNQVVKLKVAAYPFQRYGLLDGSIALISADSSDPKQAPVGHQPALTYRALVNLDSERLNAPAGRGLALNAGMFVTAEIHQGERTVLEYLLSPVGRVGREAARER